MYLGPVQNLKKVSDEDSTRLYHDLEFDCGLTILNQLEHCLMLIGWMVESLVGDLMKIKVPNLNQWIGPTQNVSNVVDSQKMSMMAVMTLSMT